MRCLAYGCGPATIKKLQWSREAWFDIRKIDELRWKFKREAEETLSFRLDADKWHAVRVRLEPNYRLLLRKYILRRGKDGGDITIYIYIYMCKSTYLRG